MRTLLRLLLAALLACAPAISTASAAHAADRMRVLVLTAGTPDAETAAFALERLGMDARRWNFDLVEGTPDDLADLAGFDVVMFLNTEGDILDAAQREALEDFIGAGGGFVGTHSAAATETDWDAYANLLGALAEPLEPGPESTDEIDFESDSSITDGLGEPLEVKERWYTYDRDPAEEGATILADLGSGEPAVWSVDGVNSFYTAAGGSHDTWTEREFLQLIRQALWWAADQEGDLVQYSGDVAPSWPYTLSFILFVGAVAAGGIIAVWRLDRAELAQMR